jgi:hypothetical protein
MGVSLLLPACSPMSVKAAVFTDGAAAVEKASAAGGGLAAPKPFGPPADILDQASGLQAGLESAPRKAIDDHDSAPTIPPLGKSLIEQGYAQAREAAARQFRWGLQWAGGILAGAGLIAGVGFYVCRRRRRSRPRANTMIHLLMLPTACPVPPKPPVPEALPQPDAATRQKLRSAA